MEQLPVELLTQILSELDQTSLGRCAQLSRRWRQIVAQPWLWRRIRIRANPSVNPNLIARLTAWLSASLLELRADRLIALELAPLLSKSKNLQKFTLEKPQNEADHADRDRRPGPNPLSVLGRCCPRLRSLRLHYSGWLFTEDAAKQLLAGCPSLAELDFAKFRQLLSRLPRLAELALPYSNINNSMAELLIHPLHGGGIHGLRLDFCTQLTADRFGRLAAACPRLRSLCIGECRVLDGAAYRLLVDRLPAGVEELRIVRFTRCRLADADLAARCRWLCLRICPLLELEDFAGLGLSEGLRACQGLTHLTLDVCHDDRLPALLVQLPRLRCLRLLDCRRLTGRAWANLRTVQNCSADLLELRVLLYLRLTASLTNPSPASPMRQLLT
uniref:F-box domain-containing protein n=1 Tax=Macrostomum lignano TaxID=282301 RepID=A0A1I8IKS3_9PLAT